MTVVVDAINRMFARRLAAHVGKEVGVVAPSRIDRDPASSIVFVVRTLRVFASSVHVSPSLPLRRAVSFAMSGSSFAKIFAAKASARLGATTSQIAAGNVGFCSAIAVTKPSCTFNVLDRSQASKSLTGDIDEFHIGKRNNKILISPAIYVAKTNYR
jgi:hypothetical protein